MINTSAEVIRLPNDLCRLREADRLVKGWLEIHRKELPDAEKVMQLMAWRLQMLKHEDCFGGSVT
jgi:hypothetical protein